MRCSAALDLVRYVDLDVRVSLPIWAQWKVRRRPAQAFASVRLQSGDGPLLAGLLAIGRGWVSVRVRRGDCEQCEVWRPDQVDWTDAQLHEKCRGIVVTIQGKTHAALLENKAKAEIWKWIDRAVAVGASVDAVW